MTAERLKAFSDGVLAIIVTIMVLELKPPHGEDFSALLALWPTFLAYVLSFLYVAIYWNNHHHLFVAAEQVDGATLWANIHLLFWLSLLPVATAWASDTVFARDPVMLYGVILLGSACAYYLLVRVLKKAQGRRGLLHEAIGRDAKGAASIVLYVAGVLAALLSPALGCLFYVAVAGVWLIPDRRIERRLGLHPKP